MLAIALLFGDLAIGQLVISTSTGSYRGAQYPVRFLGIRYGTAERWQKASVVSATETIADSTNFGPACPQVCREVSSFCPVKVSEDCLFLNVWTPFPNSIPAIAVPVFVYIHGGSFMTGAGSIDVLDGQNLANELNSIVITFNYRLSIFGFPGFQFGAGFSANPGYLDQQLALEWVLANVHFFGGDRSRVMLAGQSAGALSVLWHLQHFPADSFQSALVMSLPALPFRSEIKSRAIMARVSEALGCINQRQSCLSAKSTREILNALEFVNGKGKENEPVIDLELIPVVDGREIAHHPLKPSQSLSPKLKIIVGVTSNETIYSIQKSFPASFGKETSSFLLYITFDLEKQFLVQIPLKNSVNKKMYSIMWVEMGFQEQ
jgi:para-nitrobenzyl esterase